jgi:hypothetical protein
MRCAFAILAFIGSTHQLQAQRDSLVGPGDRVWVRARLLSGSLDRGVKGVVERVSADTLLVRPSAGGPLTPVWPSAGTQLLVFTGRKSSAGHGAGLGILLGAGLGTGLGLVLCREDSIVQGGRAGCAAGAGLGLGIIGLAAGLVIGGASSHEVWTPSTGLPSFYFPGTRRVLVSTSNRGLQLAMGISF